MKYPNLIAMIDASFEAHGARDCIRVKRGGQWDSWTWRQVKDKVLSLSAALEKLGIRDGDTVAILSQTRPEWTLADIAIISVGAITVPIYASNLSDEVSFIVENSDAKAIFVEDRNQLKKVLDARERLPKLQHIILMTGKMAPEGVRLLSTLLKTNPDRANAYRHTLRNVRGDHLASIVYTSGTTGRPKGAMLTHANFLAEVEAIKEVISVGPQDTSLLFLPLAHILARVGQFYHLRCGFMHAYAESIEKLADNMQDIRPHFLIAVPRIFEKVYERILSQVHSGSDLKQRLFHWASSVGSAVSQAKQKRRGASLPTKLQHLLVNQIVFKKIRDRLGGRLRFAVCGGAPLSKDIAEFFHGAGIDILEGYGLTETTAAINCVTTELIEFGSVGRPLPGIVEKIAEDGEVLVRGEMVFKGYYKNEEATREVLEPDGWFHTGDIGEFKENGSLRITDRKKDIIVTAGGKNVAPQKIENMLKLNKYISQAVVHGDRRKFLTALITLNPEEIEKYASEKGIEANNSKLMKHQSVYQLVKSIVDDNNKQLPSYETVKRFAILESDLTEEAGELTPSLKVKRRYVSKKYEDIIDGLYQDGGK